MLLVIIIWALLFGGACYFIARERNRDPGSWAMLGALFGVFALVVLCAIPALKPVYLAAKNEGTPRLADDPEIGDSFLRHARTERATLVKPAPMRALVDPNNENTTRQSLDTWNGKPPAALVKIMAELDVKRRQAGIDAALIYASEPLRRQIRTVELALDMLPGTLSYTMSLNKKQELVGPLFTQLEAIKEAGDTGRVTPEQCRTFRDSIDNVGRPAECATLIAAVDAAIEIAQRLESEVGGLREAT